MQADRRADLVLHGGRVFDGVRVLPHASAVAIKAGRVAALGSDAEVRAHFPSAADSVDLRGRLLAPAFTDAHVHPLMAGLERLTCDLTDADDDQDTRDRIRTYAAAHPAAEWVVGGGWLKEDFPGGLPSATDLDEIVPDRPVLLRDNDHHAVWVNSVALRLAGIDASTPDPPGGNIARLDDGRPRGTLHESAMDRVLALVPPAPLEDQVEALRRSQELLHSLGIVGWQDAILGAYAGHPDPTAAYVALASSGRLTARVVGALWWPRGVDRHQVDEVVVGLVAAREAVRRAVPDGRFRATSVKVMADGVVESRTAAMTRPYEGFPASATGLMHVEPRMLRDVAVALARHAFQLHVHAIGDLAVRCSLDAIEAANAGPASAPDLRHHIAHLQVVDPHDVPRFGAAGVTANVQALWACHEPAMDSLNIPLLGAERARWQYPFRALARSGAPLAMGSDWPVSSPDPLAAIEVAVTRRAPATERPPLLAEQSLDVLAAMSAYTRGSARVNHNDEAGVIASGALADLVVLDQDVTAVPAREIHTIRVDLTLVDGAAVFSR